MNLFPHCQFYDQRCYISVHTPTNTKVFSFKDRQTGRSNTNLVRTQLSEQTQKQAKVHPPLVSC